MSSRWPTRGRGASISSASTSSGGISSRALCGASDSVFNPVTAPLAVLSAYLVGTAIGMVAGYDGGWVDIVISRVSDVILSFPVLILYIILITTFGPSAVNIIVAVTVASSPGIGRIVRSLVLDLRSSEYVAMAQVRGESSLYIMFVEIRPNARGPMIVDACLRMGYVTIAIGVLGFLGLGLRPPTPDWGGMVRDATSLITARSHMAILPCVAITTVVIGFNLLADGLRELSLSELTMPVAVAGMSGAPVLAVEDLAVSYFTRAGEVPGCPWTSRS